MLTKSTVVDVVEVASVVFTFTFTMPLVAATIVEFAYVLLVAAVVAFVAELLVVSAA